MILAEKKIFDIICIGAVGIDTNVYLYSNEVNFDVEMNFSENVDYVGQAGGYSSRIATFLGLKTGFIGFIGSDFQGEFIKHSFNKWGIESLWFIDPKGTKRSINVMNKAGERKNFYDGKGSMETLPDKKLCTNFLSRTRLAHFNIVNWSRHLLPLAKELGILISCDLQDISDLSDSYRNDFINSSDILFFSAVNINNMQTVIKTLRSMNSKAIIVVGLGSNGAGLSLPEQDFTIYSIPKLEFQIIDTNGAGDSLAIGFLYAYIILKRSITDSILFGQINAQYTCSMRAPKSHFLNQDEILKLFTQIRQDYFLDNKKATPNIKD